MPFLNLMYCSYRKLNGYALIFGHDEFEGKPNLKRDGNGTEMDSLETTFRQLGLTVIRHINCTSEGVINAINGRKYFFTFLCVFFKCLTKLKWSSSGLSLF